LTTIVSASLNKDLTNFCSVILFLTGIISIFVSRNLLAPGPNIGWIERGTKSSGIFNKVSKISALSEDISTKQAPFFIIGTHLLMMAIVTLIGTHTSTISAFLTHVLKELQIVMLYEYFLGSKLIFLLSNNDTLKLFFFEK
jgi:hypothetical protein